MKKKANKTYRFDLDGKNYYAKVFKMNHIEADSDLLRRKLNEQSSLLLEKLKEQESVNYELMTAHAKCRSEKQRANKLFGAIILLCLSLALAIVSHFVF